MRPIAVILSAAAAFAVFPLSAQDEVAAETPAQGQQAAAGEEGAAEPGANPAVRKSDTKFFYTLPTVSRLEGSANVLKPGARDWEVVEEGRFYPLGSVFSTIGEATRMTVKFGAECSVVTRGVATFGTRSQGLSEKSRAILLKGGEVGVKLPRVLPSGMFSVDAPGFTVVDLKGNSSYRYVKTGDGDRASIRCVTGELAVEGRHFRILSMRAANEVSIQTSQDALFTGIYGVRGDCICKLDQGLVKIRDVETGESHSEPKFLEGKVSPQTAVRIQRAVPAIGENMAVTIMTFDAKGTMKNRCAFAENRFEINSGELAPHDKTSRENLAKKAAEATAETAAAAETVEVAPVEEPAADAPAAPAAAGDAPAAETPAPAPAAPAAPAADDDIGF